MKQILFVISQNVSFLSIGKMYIFARFICYKFHELWIFIERYLFD